MNTEGAPGAAPAPPSASPRPLATWLRLLLTAAGLLALGLGLLGVLLPGLPTTPFVLLAALCFTRASPRLHRWLLHNRLTGPLLRDWEAHRSLTRRVRRVALGSMGIMVLVSVWGLQAQPWLQVLVALAGAVGAWVVLRIPVRSDRAAARREAP